METQTTHRPEASCSWPTRWTMVQTTEKLSDNSVDINTYFYTFEDKAEFLTWVLDTNERLKDMDPDTYTAQYMPGTCGPWYPDTITMEMDRLKESN